MFASNTFDDILGALTALSQRVDILKALGFFNIDHFSGGKSACLFLYLF